MTFEVREVSIESGAPIMLVQFSIGSKTWRFAAADQIVTLDSNDYLPMPMKISDIRESGEIVRNDIKLTVPFNFPIAELWRTSPPTGTVLAIVKEVHDGDTEMVTAWQGHVGNVSWPSSAQAEIQLSPGIIALKSTGLRRLYSRNCPHVLYQIGAGQCNVDRELWRTAATVISNSNITLQADAFSAFASGKLAGGFIQWTSDDGITDYRFIVANEGTAVTLMTPAPLLAVDDAFDFFPGCNRTISRCAEFSNTDNYGGMPYFTTRNPFDGQLVY